MFVRQDPCAFRHIRLTRHPIRQSEAAARRPLLDSLQDRRIVLQFQPEEVGRDFTRNVVRRRPQTAGDEDDLRPVQRFRDGLANRLTIRDRDLTLDPQPERKDFPRDEVEMGVEHIADEKLRARVNDDDIHVESLKRTIARFNASTF